MSLSPTVEAAAAAAGSGRRPSVFLRPPASADRAGRRRNPPTRLGRGHHLFGMRFGLPGLGGPAAPWGRGPSASKRLEWRPSFRSSSHGPSFEPTGTHQLELRIRLNCQDDTRQDAGHGCRLSCPDGARAGWSRDARGIRMSFRLSFHQAPLGPSGAHWLDDPSDLTCKDSTQHHPVDDPLLSCKQVPRYRFTRLRTERRARPRSSGPTSRSAIRIDSPAQLT
jgi:hypothetical protein